MGRQMFVVFIVFFSAKLTTIHSETGDDFLFPIPDWFRSVFLETGLLACILVVILAQLMPQIVAAHFPVAFLEYTLCKYGYYACIFLEWTGINTLYKLFHNFWLSQELNESQSLFVRSFSSSLSRACCHLYSYLVLLSISVP